MCERRIFMRNIFAKYLILALCLATLAAQAADAPHLRRGAEDDFEIRPNPASKFAPGAFVQSNTWNSFPLFARRPSFYAWSPNIFNSNCWYSPALSGYSPTGNNVSGYANGYAWNPWFGWNGNNANNNLTNTWTAWNNPAGWNGLNNATLWNPWTGWNNAATSGPTQQWYNSHGTGVTQYVPPITTTTTTANNNAVYYQNQLQSWTRPQNIAIAQQPNGAIVYYTPPTITTGMVNGYNPALPAQTAQSIAVQQQQVYSPAAVSRSFNQTQSNANSSDLINRRR